MILIEDLTKLRQKIADEKQKKNKISVVPTMGSLHEGHLALVKEAKKIADFVIVTIFVNKAQFNQKQDYDKYPRNLESDLSLLQKEEVDLVFAPDSSQIYDDEINFIIKPKKIADCLCGKFRHGHFEGVCMIIVKFFNIIKPDFAIFGKKDFQQYLIIQKLAQDLNYDTKIIGAETIRSENGLALSSRNKRLQNNQLEKAFLIYKALNNVKKSIFLGQNIIKTIERESVSLIENGFEKIDYFEVRNQGNLELVTESKNIINCRIFIAVYLNGVRLIDNLQI